MRESVTWDIGLYISEEFLHRSRSTRPSFWFGESFTCLWIFYKDLCLMH